MTINYQSYEPFFNPTWYPSSWWRNAIPFTIVKNKIETYEIIDNNYHVTIDGMYEIDINEIISDVTMFKVNYSTGTIYFDSSLNGQTKNVTYMAIGKYKYDSANINLNNSTNYSSENVQDFANEIGSRVDNIIAHNGDGTTPTTLIDALTDVNGVTHGTLRQSMTANYTYNSNKIGDLLGSGISEADLSTAIKNDRTQLADITQFKLIADINGTSYITGDSIDFAWLKNQQCVLLSKFYRNLIKNVAVTIACRGDSLTYGHDVNSADKRPSSNVTCPDGSICGYTRASTTYPEALQTFLSNIYGASNINVSTQGFSGDWLEISYNRWYTKHNADLTILMFGTNDSRADYVPSDLKGNIAAYINWYEQTIIREIIWGKAVIILAPPKTKTAGDLDIHSFTLALKTLGEKYGVPVVDSAEFMANYPSTIYSDDTHYNGEGYKLFGAKVASLFLGNGIMQPMHIGSNKVLLTRPNLDSITYYGNAILGSSGGQTETPSEINPNEGIISYWGGSTNGIIYSFYTDEEDLLLIPLYYSSTGKLRLTLDFNTVSPHNSNDLIVGQSQSFSETLIKQIEYSSPSVPTLDDFIKPSSEIQPQLIRIAEKGWHTLQIDTSDTTAVIAFNSLLFMSYRDFKNKQDILNLQTTMKAYVFQTNATYDDTTNVTQSVVAYDTIKNALGLPTISEYWKSIPIKIKVYNYDQSVLEYTLMFSSKDNTYGWNFFSTPIRNNIAGTPTERTISSITYDSTNKNVLINWGGTTTRPANIVIS